METFENSPPTSSGQTELPLMSSAEASPAKTSALPEVAPDWRENAAAYGRIMPDLLASFDHATSSWKTSQRCLVEDLAMFSEAWPRSGMMRSGTAYRLPPLAPLTDATEFGLWPTPNARQKGGGEYQDPAKILARWSQGRQRNLSEAVRLWPTPRANDAEKRGAFDVTNPRNGLPAAAKMFPTPCARDYRSPGRSRLDRTGSKAVESLPQIVGGQLNPLWVAWLMGFPIEWASFAPTETP